MTLLVNIRGNSGAHTHTRTLHGRKRGDGLHMRKCQLLCLSSFVAHSWLLTHDREDGGNETELERGLRRDKDKARGRPSVTVREWAEKWKKPSYPPSSPDYLTSELNTGRPRPTAFSSFITHKSGCGVFTYLNDTSCCGSLRTSACQGLICWNAVCVKHSKFWWIHCY